MHLELRIAEITVTPPYKATYGIMLPMLPPMHCVVMVGGAAHLLWLPHRPPLCRRGLFVSPPAVLTTTHLHKQV